MLKIDTFRLNQKYLRENLTLLLPIQTYSVQQEKSDAFGAALTQSVTKSLPEGSSSSAEKVMVPTALKSLWAEFLGKNPNKLSKEHLIELKELCHVGKNNKKNKVGTERVHQILVGKN